MATDTFGGSLDLGEADQGRLGTIVVDRCADQNISGPDSVPGPRRGTHRRRRSGSERRSTADVGGPSSGTASSGSIIASTPPADNRTPAGTPRFTRASAIGPDSWWWATEPTRPTVRPSAVSTASPVPGKVSTEPSRLSSTSRRGG